MYMAGVLLAPAIKFSIADTGYLPSYSATVCSATKSHAPVSVFACLI